MSELLEAANKRLMQLRAQCRADKEAQKQSRTEGGSARLSQERSGSLRRRELRRLHKFKKIANDRFPPLPDEIEPEPESPPPAPFPSKAQLADMRRIRRQERGHDRLTRTQPPQSPSQTDPAGVRTLRSLVEMDLANMPPPPDSSEMDLANMPPDSFEMDLANMPPPQNPFEMGLANMALPPSSSQIDVADVDPPPSSSQADAADVDPPPSSSQMDVASVDPPPSDQPPQSSDKTPQSPSETDSDTVQPPQTAPQTDSADTKSPRVSSKAVLANQELMRRREENGIKRPVSTEFSEDSAETGLEKQSYRPRKPARGRSGSNLSELELANIQLMRRRKEDGVGQPEEEKPSPWLEPLRNLITLSVPEFGYDPDVILAIHPNILVNAVKYGQPTGWMAWKIARLADKRGQGWVPRDWLRDALCEHLQITQKQSLRILNKAVGLFFHKGSTNKKFFYVQSGTVAAELHCQSISSKTFALPISDLESFKSIRRIAYLCALALWSSDSQPLSRALIQHLTGISPRTQQSYDHELDPRSCRRVHAFVYFDQKDCCLQTMSYKFGNALLAIPGSPKLRIQLPNCYLTDVDQYGRGRSARVRRKFREVMLREKSRNWPITASDRTTRRFHPQPRPAIKSALRGNNTLAPAHKQKSGYFVFEAYNIEAYK